VTDVKITAGGVAGLAIVIAGLLHTPTNTGLVFWGVVVLMLF
jgi:hypothetical protein